MPIRWRTGWSAGIRALQVMEDHLQTRDYFAANQLTVADIALYAYTHVADQCDYDLAGFPAVRAWLRARRAGAADSCRWTGPPPRIPEDQAGIAAE